MAFQFIQLTNQNVGAVAQGGLVPLGSVTRRYACGGCNPPVLTASTTGNNTVTINEAGFYEVQYTLSGVFGGTGAATINLLQDGATLLTATETVTAAGDTENITLTYIVRVLPACASVANVPSTIQVLLTANTLTAGVSNMIVRKIR